MILGGKSPSEAIDEAAHLPSTALGLGLEVLVDGRTVEDGAVARDSHCCTTPRMRRPCQGTMELLRSITMRNGIVSSDMGC